MRRPRPHKQLKLKINLLKQPTTLPMMTATRSQRRKARRRRRDSLSTRRTDSALRLISSSTANLASTSHALERSAPLASRVLAGSSCMALRLKNYRQEVRSVAGIGSASAAITVRLLSVPLRAVAHQRRPTIYKQSINSALKALSSERSLVRTPLRSTSSRNHRHSQRTRSASSRSLLTLWLSATSPSIRLLARASASYCSIAAQTSKSCCQ